MPAALEDRQTWSAFEAESFEDGGVIKGISLLQEGPALGHGVFVDKTMLSQVVSLGKKKGTIKSQMDHWSSLGDAVGYFTNFRVKGDKALADFTPYKSSPHAGLLREMIEETPGAFGVSIVFDAAEPEYKQNVPYARVANLLGADFVSRPAANRDGVFDTPVDSGKTVMPEPTQPAAPEVTKAEFDALKQSVDTLTAQLAKFSEKPAENPAEQKFSAEDMTALAEALADKLKLKAFTALPPATPATPTEPEKGAEPKQFSKDSVLKQKAEFFGDATGLKRLEKAREWAAKHQKEDAFLKSLPN